MDRNVLILTYWSYDDALIQTYTLPYLKIIKNKLPAGSTLYLVTLEKNPKQLEKGNRIAIAGALKKEGISWFPLPYFPFGPKAFFMWLRAFFRLSWLIIKKNIDVIHCWCTPPGAIGYLLSVLLNRKLILDSYEPHAEAMVENGTWKPNSFALRLLFWLEKKQSKRASCVISATQGMHTYAIEKYGVSLKEFYVKPACVDLNLFSIDQIKDQTLLTSLGLQNKVVCVYAGKFGGIYLDKEVFAFFKSASKYWGDTFRVLLLTSHSDEEIEKFCDHAMLDKKIVIKKFIPHSEIPLYLGLADFAITPVKPVPSKRFCTPIKDGEYWAMGLPVIIPSGISDDSKIISDHDIGYVLENLNADQYQLAIEKIDKMLRTPRTDRYNRIRIIAEQYRSFKIADAVYEVVYKKVFD